MDVRGVLRRSRLSLVTSLFLAALLGGPAVAVTVTNPAAAPGPAAVSVTGSVAVTQSVTTATSPDLTAAEPARDRLDPAFLEATVPTRTGLAVATPAGAEPAVQPRTARLTSRLRAAVAGPRAPPAAA